MIAGIVTAVVLFFGAALAMFFRRPPNTPQISPDAVKRLVTEQDKRRERVILDLEKVAHEIDTLSPDELTRRLNGGK